MAKLCVPGIVPPQPGPESGWSFTANRFGPAITNKTPKVRGTEKSWTHPSTLLKGLTLPQWRKAWLAHCAKDWVTNPDLDKTSFEDNASGYVLYNLKGESVVPTPWNVYMWAATVQWGPLAWMHYQSGFFTWDPLDLFCDTPQTVVDPPAIQSASIAADMTLSITINPTLDSYYLLVYTSTPRQRIVKLPKLLACRSFLNFGTAAHTFTVTSAQMLDLFNQFPTGSNAMVGARWVYGYNCLNSQAAAELVEIGA
jgi:hypothetical protein